MPCLFSRRSFRTAVLLTLSLVTPMAGRAETRRIAAGPEYERSDFHSFLWGRGYRELWATPIDVEILDFAKEAGGLEVVRQVGGMQTPGLALKGADGRAYTFRSIRKDLSRILPVEWQETLVAEHVRDQNSANHPGAALFVNGLAESLPWAALPPQRLVVMPDDPILGEHQKLFAGKLGTFGEYPLPASDGQAGFMNATEILSSKKLWHRWLEDPKNRVDTELFLRYRIADIWTGNWDRHSEQWRWADVPDKERWQPIPEDPDQVLVNYQGVLLWLARWHHPKLVAFKDEISGMEGMTYNGAGLDRWVLTDLDRTAFQRVTREIQTALTDDVIDSALKHLPAEWYAASGEDIAAKLKKRRDNLGEAIERYYLHLAGEVNIHGTDRNELARIRRFDDGSVEVSMALGEDDTPYYRRRFDAEETRSVRVHLHGGNDRAVCEGPPKGNIEVLVLGGPGDDVLDDSRGGNTRFYDSVGQNEVRKGKGTREDTRPWENPIASELRPWLEPRDFGTWTKPEALLSHDEDLGLLLKAGFNLSTWRFRKYPHANNHRVMFGVSADRGKAEFDYSGSFHMENSHFSVEPNLRISGLERINFFGFGNDTEEDEDLEDEEYYEVSENMVLFNPTVNWRPSEGFEMFFGPELKYTEETSDDTLIEEARPYGSGEFGQLGLILGLNWDTRGEEGPLYASMGTQQAGGRQHTGIGLTLEGSCFPEMWDVEDTFGAVEGTVAGSLGLGQHDDVVVAAQVGGRKLWGDFPWHEAAFVGGPGSVRGFSLQRFSGEEAAYGSLELRVNVLEGTFILPGGLWAFCFADTGRTWVDEDDSDKWHSTYGAGVVFELSATPIKIRAEIARNDEDDSFSSYFSTGFTY